MKPKRQYYSKADEGFLIKFFLEYSDEQLAKILGRSVLSIQGKRFKLGLKRPPVCIGHGQPRPIQNFERKPNSGNFQKGQLPKNTLPEGAESIQKNKGAKRIMIKKDGKLQLKSQVIWRENFGEIPENFIIIFKDKNPLNCVLENLECISRAENAKRNQNREKASQTMKDTWGYAREMAEKGHKLLFFKSPHFNNVFEKLNKN